MLNFRTFVNLLNSSDIVHTKSEDALVELVSTDKHKVNYRRKEIIVPNNLGFISKDEDGNYYTEIKLPYDVDILTDFSFPENVIITLNESKVPLKYDSYVIPCCAMYSEINLRITFANIPEKEIEITYTCSILKNEIRNNLRQKTVYTDFTMYKNGVFSQKQF